MVVLATLARHWEYMHCQRGDIKGGVGARSGSYKAWQSNLGTLKAEEDRTLAEMGGFSLIMLPLSYRIHIATRVLRI